MIPSGYKQTKVGVVPEDWDVVKLGNYTNIKHGWAFKGEYFSEQGKYILLTPGNFFEEGGFRLRIGKEKFYTGEYPKEYLLKKDDLIVAMTEQGAGLLGSPALIPENKKYLHNQRLGLFQDLKRDFISIKYLYYLFCTKYVRGEIISRATGTKVKHTSPKIMLNIEIPLPLLKEQQKIAQILTTWDDAISKQEKIIKAKERLKKGLMQKLLGGEVRFTGFDEEWEYKKIGDVFNISAGGDIKKEHVSMSRNKLFKYPIFANSDKKNGLYGYSDIYKIDKECVTVTGRGSLGIAKARFEKFFPIVRLLVLIGKIPTDYKFYENAINELNFFVESTGVPQLTGPQVSSYKIVYPAIQEQQKIAQVLTTADKEIELLKKEFESLKEQKKGLMQRLLSGEVRTQNIKGVV